MYLKIFDNYHAGVAMLPEAEQDAFWGGAVRYALQGIEPKFEGVLAMIWATIKPLIDKSQQGQSNGVKGGDGRGNSKPSKTQDENPPEKPTRKTQDENPPEKPTRKTQGENHKKRKERNRKENPEGFFSIPSDACDEADAAEPPVCPACRSPMTPTNSRSPGGRKAIWRCERCCETAEVAT